MTSQMIALESRKTFQRELFLLCPFADLALPCHQPPGLIIFLVSHDSLAVQLVIFLTISVPSMSVYQWFLSKFLDPYFGRVKI